MQYSPDFIETMKTRATSSQALIQPGDEFWVSMKTTPGPGTTTGVGGYMTFYAGRLFVDKRTSSRFGA